MSMVLEQTPLFAWHVAHGGRMVDFGGWSMPLCYSSIVAEHVATRTGCSLFDISHMGRFRVDGPADAAAALLDRIVTRRVADQAAGRVRYALVTNEVGGVLDDVLVYHLRDAAAAPYFLVVVNASNRAKIWSWFASHAADSECAITDASDPWAMIAIQGPAAQQTLQPLIELDLASLKYYTASEARIGAGAGIVSRTGYTGEDGFELIVGAAAVGGLWETLVERGAVPAGLGARDTLRLEAGMPLYGHELSESINPLEAGLGFAVDLEGRSFPGHDRLAEACKAAPSVSRVGLTLAGKRLPRQSYAVLAGDRRVGEVTSGTMSPSLGVPIAMAYVDSAVARPDTKLEIDIRDRREPATVVELPFYRRPSRGTAP